MGKAPDRLNSGYYPPHRNDPPPQRPEPKRKLNIPRLCLLIACIVVFCFCAYELIHYFTDILRTRRSTEELGAVYAASETVAPSEAVPTATVPPVPSATQAVATIEPTVAAASPTTDPQSAAALWPSTYATNPRLTISQRFLDLLEKNDDIVGWLTIKGVVDEPVVQRDNEFYLTHNASGDKSVTGALFLDETCDLRTISTQLIVHGHNMKEGAMFGSLKNYKVRSAAFYRENPYITFNTLYEDGQYVIFAALSVDVRSAKRDYLPFWSYTRFASADAFTRYINRVRSLSHYSCGVSVEPGDRLLTLSTCTGTDENMRFLLMARKLRDDEDMTKLKTQILATGDK